MGKYADRVILQTYDWGTRFGPPAAGAPLAQADKTLRYAVSEIPPEKIWLGVPLTGFDWVIPYKKGAAARAVGPLEAESIAKENRSLIRFDEKSQSPYFNYTLGGREHAVWFEDVRSVGAKLRLVREYGLGGVSFWAAQPIPTVWLKAGMCL